MFEFLAFDLKFLTKISILCLSPDISCFLLTAIIDDDVIRYERVKKKGYVRVVTNYGQLNLELHCDMVRGCPSV